MSDPADLARALGEQLRQARQRGGLTLGEIAARTELSAAFLSRLERGEANASIANLIRLSSTLGVSLAQLFGEAQASPPPTHVLMRRATAAADWIASPNGYAWRRLGGDLRQPLLDAFELEFPPTRRRHIALVAHEGEEFLLILSGRVDFQIGAERLMMETGDSVHFDAGIPHMGRNAGDAPARMLMVHTRSGAGAQMPPIFQALADAGRTSAARGGHK
jgi:transcriptional regulator with XRE-family HTH domain